jgi:hypothetical protein
MTASPTPQRPAPQGESTPRAPQVPQGPVLFQQPVETAAQQPEPDVAVEIRNPRPVATPHDGLPPGGASLHIVPETDTAPGGDGTDRDPDSDAQPDGRSSGRARPRRAKPGEHDYDPVAAMRRLEATNVVERVPLGDVYRWLRVKPATVHTQRHRGLLRDPDQDGCYALPWLIKWAAQKGYYDPLTLQPRREELPETTEALAA